MFNAALVGRTNLTNDMGWLCVTNSPKAFHNMYRSRHAHLRGTAYLSLMIEKRIQDQSVSLGCEYMSMRCPSQ